MEIIMSEEIYVNQTTGKKYRLVDTIHVWDDEPGYELNFIDTAYGVASWCVETHDFVHYVPFDIDEDDEEKWIKEQENKLLELLEKEEYEKILEITDCRHCKWQYEYQTIEEVGGEQ